MKFSDIEILEKICQTKYVKLKQFGANLGYEIPNKREVDIIKPVVIDDKKSPLIIAEIKRASPTKGYIGDISNPIKLAQTYLSQGANAISVLCEEDYFKGSLKDLQDVKNAFPNICILRKDFILQKDEVKVSYLCGADMILLIVAVFANNMESFIEIYNEVLSYNLTPLVEIHNIDEYKLICDMDLTRAVVGINSRNLKTFEINKMDTIKLRSSIPRNIPVIFESGIQSDYDAFVAGSSGFDGILCGSFLVEKLDNNISNTLHSLKNIFLRGCKHDIFYRIVRRFHDKNSLTHVNYKQNILKPLVKACGINDNKFLVECFKYADLLGFILTDKSPRFVDMGFMKNMNNVFNEYFADKEYKPIRVGVVTQSCLKQGMECLHNGYIDCIQLHDVALDFFIQNNGIESKQKKSSIFYGDISIWNLNDEIKDYNILPFYPTMSCDLSVLNQDSNFHFNTHFALFDSSAGSANKLDTKQIKDFLNKQTGFCNNLWLAGGICRDNIDSILDLNPMLIDVCSGFEIKKGEKNIQLMLDFFNYLDIYYKEK